MTTTYYINIFIYLLLVLFLLVLMYPCAVSDGDYDKGKSSYNILRANTEEKSERANCMKGAFSQLNATCASLNDTLVSYLALKFTICHYQSTQRELPQECTAAIPTPESTTNCTNALSENAFIIYTQFFTHTLASCYFLEAKVWQERTEQTIHKLGDVAVQSANKIEQSLSQSEELIRGQTILQTKASQLNEKHDSLHGKIDENHLKMDQLSRTISEYYTMISEILAGLSLSSAKLEQMVNLVLGETQQMSSFLFYFTATTAAFVLTVPSRTNGARLKIVSAIVIHLLLERLLFTVTYSLSPDLYTISTGVTYYTRLSLVLVALLILINSGYNYRDYSVLLSAISSQLDKERRENERFREDIQNEIKISSTSLHDKFDLISKPYLSPKEKEKGALIPMKRHSIHRTRKRLDDAFGSRECSPTSTPFKSCLSDSAPVKELDSTLSSFLAQEYDSGVEDCTYRKELQLSIQKFNISTYGSSYGSSCASTPNRPIPPQSFSSSNSRYHLRQRK